MRARHLTNRIRVSSEESEVCVWRRWQIWQEKDRFLSAGVARTEE